MTVAEQPRLRPTAPGVVPTAAPARLRPEMTRAAAWMLAAMAARGAMAARIEGLLDHDQAVVGLMALDITQGRRWPLFFDGQRYMGAFEAYTAALFVRLFGHAPTVVALAPVLYCGLFAAGQYLLWRVWSGRRAGHLAAAFTVACAPMPAFWTFIPRGGYVEVLAWAVPVLGLYRHLTRPGAPPLSWPAQFGWGLLLAVGYVINPLALIVYAALFFDWTFGRHGADVRRERGLDRFAWLDGPLAAVAWAAAAGGLVVLAAVGCHVGPYPNRGDRVRFLFLLEPEAGPVRMLLGGVLLAGVAGLVLWWTGAGRRLARLLTGHVGFMFGMMLALAPFPAHNVAVRLGWLPPDLSLPIWIRAPWAVGPNLRDGARALGPLVGCDARAVAGSLAGQGIDMPPAAWPGLAGALGWLSPVAVALVVALVVTVAWRDRAAWRLTFALRRESPGPPTVLALTGLAACVGLYLLQTTSADSSSMRYLLPAWVFLPGLLATGLLAWPRAARVAVAAALLGLWGASQANLWADMGRPSALRPLADDLARRGVPAIVAHAHVALLVANLTHGEVGAVEYQTTWPRLGDRYAHRFLPGRPVVCVVDRDHGGIDDGLGLRVRALADRFPDRVRLARRLGPLEVWEAELTLAEVLDRPRPLPGSP